MPGQIACRPAHCNPAAVTTLSQIQPLMPKLADFKARGFRSSSSQISARGCRILAWKQPLTFAWLFLFSTRPDRTADTQSPNWMTMQDSSTVFFCQAFVGSRARKTLSTCKVHPRQFQFGDASLGSAVGAESSPGRSYPSPSCPCHQCIPAKLKDLHSSTECQG